MVGQSRRVLQKLVEKSVRGGSLYVSVSPTGGSVEVLPERTSVTAPPLAVGHEGEVHVCGNTIAA